VAKIISIIVKYEFPDVWTEFLEKVCDGLVENNELNSEQQLIAIDASLQTLIYSIKPDEKYNVIVDKVLENLFSAFTSSEANSKIREKCFEVYYQ